MIKYHPPFPVFPCPCFLSNKTIEAVKFSSFKVRVVNSNRQKNHKNARTVQLAVKYLEMCSEIVHLAFDALHVFWSATKQKGNEMIFNILPGKQSPKLASCFVAVSSSVCAISLCMLK